MKTIRPGTHRKIAANLRRHDELMRKFMAEGMDKDAASKKAFAEVTGKAAPEGADKGEA